MSKKTIKKVTKLGNEQKTNEVEQTVEKKKFDPVQRKKELEEELSKANNLITGLTMKLEETKRSAQSILGALELLKELE